MGCRRHDSVGEIQLFCSCGLGCCPAPPERVTEFPLAPSSTDGPANHLWGMEEVYWGGGQRMAAPPAPAENIERESAGDYDSSVIPSWQDVDPRLLSPLAPVSCLTWHSQTMSPLSWFLFLGWWTWRTRAPGSLT